MKNNSIYEIYDKTKSLIGQIVLFILKKANTSHELLLPYNWNHGILKHRENMISELVKIGIPVIGTIVGERIKKRSFRSKDMQKYLIEHEILVAGKIYHITHSNNCFTIKKIRNKDYVSIVDHYCRCFDRSYFVN